MGSWLSYRVGSQAFVRMMLNFVTLARSLLEQAESQVHVPGFQPRLIYAANLDKEEYIPYRSVAFPMYLTDLGVRIFQDPKVLFECSTGLTFSELIYNEGFLQPLFLAKIDSLSRYLDGFISLYGDYDSISSVLENRYREITQ